MRKTVKLLLPVTAIVLLAAAGSQAWAYDPYAFWAGPAYASDAAYYSPDYVPYFVSHPPVYYGYSMLLPQGEGFTMRSYSPEAARLLAEPKAPVLLKNPYVTVAASKEPKGKQAPKQAPKVKKASLRVAALQRPTANPFLTP